MFDTNLKKYEIFWMPQLSLEFQSWDCYEPFNLKNVIHSSLLRKIVIETQCIDCINDHFWCQFEKIWTFLNASYYFWISIMALFWYFYAQKCSPFVLVSKNCHRDTVYRLWKWPFLLPIWQTMKFSKFLSTFIWVFIRALLWTF